jgi:3-oxoacyl-[acyl-carrier protein] reductase
MRLLNKVALITGSASGFGKGMAERFTKEGAKVAIIDINIEAAKSLSKKLGKNTIAIYCDVTKVEDIEKAVNLTIEKFGTIDIVINNAGWTHLNQPMLEVDEETFTEAYGESGWDYLVEDKGWQPDDCEIWIQNGVKITEEETNEFN